MKKVLGKVKRVLGEIWLGFRIAEENKISDRNLLNKHKSIYIFH